MLADCTLPGFDGAEALTLFRQKYSDEPFIMVSGTVDDEKSAELIKNGATDFVPKRRLEKLVPAVQRGLREMAEKKEQRQSELLRQSS